MPRFISLQIQPARIKGALKHGKRTRGHGLTAHKGVDGRIATFGPCVDADMRFRENGHAGNTPVGLEPMKVDIKERSASDLGSLGQCARDEFYVGEQGSRHVP